MKVLFARIAWMLYTILVILPTLATATPPPKEKLEYKTITWHLDENPETYSRFISSLRNAFNSYGRICEIPITAKSPKPADAFILVDVINTSGKTITLAFLTSDFYFAGFKDTVTDTKGRTVTRANFVDHNINYLKNHLFTDAKIKKKLPFGENYVDIVRTAQVGSRENFELGVSRFSTCIDKIYGKDYKGVTKPGAPEKDIGKNLAKFGLIAIQIISEATRFKYIEDKVKELGMVKPFKPDSTVTKLENNWDPLSTLIRKSSPGCKAVKSPDFPQWDDIKKQLGLLLKGTNKGLADDDDHLVPFVEGIFGNNNDNNDDALENVARDFIM